MTHHLSSFLRLCVAAATLPAAAWCAPVYRIEALGTPDSTQAHAINNRGSITGDDASERAFLRRADRTLKRLTPKAGETFGKALNDADLVVYSILTAEVITCGVWDASRGSHHVLGTLGGDYCSPSGVNRSGRIVGTSSLADGRNRAFVSNGATMRDLGTLGGDTSGAAGINNRGQIAGTAQRADGSTHAFLAQDGVLADLGDLGGGYSVGEAINALGHVTGESSPAPARKGHVDAFLWDGVQMHDLGTLGGKFSYAYGINRQDEVVGMSRFAGEGDPAQHAFLYTGGAMYSLLDLLDDSRAGWGVLITAEAINDAGDIVGLGLFNGTQRAYVAHRISE